MSIKENKVSLDSGVVMKDDLPTVDLDGEVGMMHVENGKYYGMDPVGSRVWELIEKPRTVREVVSLLLKEYDVDENTCQEHVLDFINDLIKEDLISIIDSDKV